MFRSCFFRIVVFAAVAFLAVARAVHAGYVYARGLLADFALFLRSPETHGPHNAIEPRKALVSAKAFRERMAKRERPTVTDRWRMCPSG